MCLAGVSASEVASKDSCAQVFVSDKGAKDFSKSEAELVDVVGTFQRAIAIIKKEIDQEPCIHAEEDRHS